MVEHRDREWEREIDRVDRWLLCALVVSMIVSLVLCVYAKECVL